MGMHIEALLYGVGELRVCHCYANCVKLLTRRRAGRATAFQRTGKVRVSLMSPEDSPTSSLTGAVSTVKAARCASQ